MAVHQHRKGWRGSLTLTTPVYNTKAEAALADLKAKVAAWRSELAAKEAEPVKPAQAATHGPRAPDPWRPSCDYPLLIALHGPERLGL
jgi:hypothetical protein